MKTLADFKRALVIGSEWEAFNHYYQSSLGIRAVGKVQSNCFAFITYRNGESNLSYCDFPLSKDIKFREDGTVEIYKEWCDGYRLMMTYKKVEQ
jgi:hypothetical protein